MGWKCCKRTRQLDPPPPVILVTAHGDIPTAVQAMNEGAYSFIEKPLDLEYFRAQVNRAAERSALLKQNQILQQQVFDHAGLRRDHRQLAWHAEGGADRPAGCRQ